MKHATVSRYELADRLAGETALRMIQIPAFWCRAKGFLAAAAMKKAGVLAEVLREIEGLDEDAIETIMRWLDTHWNDTVVKQGFAGRYPEEVRTVPVTPITMSSQVVTITLNRQPRRVFAQAAIPRPDRCQLNAVCIIGNVAPFNYAWYAQNESMRDLGIYGATVAEAIAALERERPDASLVRFDAAEVV